MNIQAYIESGIIESYVLGLADADESAELEMLCRQHPEIQAALTNFETQIEKQAFNNAIAPPPELKDRLMDMLEQDFKEQNDSKKIPPPIVEMNNIQNAGTRQSSFWRYFAAASVILLIGSAALNLYLYNNYNDTAARYEALLAERNNLQASNGVFQTRLNGLEESFRIIQNPQVLAVKLPGVNGHTENIAAVYWDSQTKDVYLMPTKMDKAPEGKQYQLWAIVDGKPVDAGMVEDCNGLCKIKNISKAQAFAITLEDKGGSPAPHLEALYVYGNVNG